ncbi:unnamed protein product [Cuscuta epithymum]|uniref:Uncharacterized protein n=1 Tax=Cuscuta epithymum TaxID=186058 RepID=A0AAV0D481_9ASTE|nr:unnamed protein product [Cuscuta epithymum]
MVNTLILVRLPTLFMNFVKIMHGIINQYTMPEFLYAVKDQMKGFSMFPLFFNFYFQGFWSGFFIGREFCPLHVSVWYVILLAMSRGFVLLIGGIDLVNLYCSWLVKFFQPCCSNASNTCPPPEPPPRSGKKNMIN